MSSSVESHGPTAGKQYTLKGRTPRSRNGSPNRLPASTSPIRGEVAPRAAPGGWGSPGTPKLGGSMSKKGRKKGRNRYRQPVRVSGAEAAGSATTAAGS